MLVVVWATSIGWMAVVNVLIGSDFKRPLLDLAGLWGIALILGWAAHDLSGHGWCYAAHGA